MSFMNYWPDLQLDEATSQAADIDTQLVAYSSLENTEGDNESTPQAASINHQYISHSSPGSTSLLEDTGIVRNRQRVVKPRPKQTYPCVFFGAKCEFIPDEDGFKNCTRVKEDALRHINAYQCTNCGKRFGKKYTLFRHCRDRKTPCTKDTKEPPICSGLALGLEWLESAKNYPEIKSASDVCKLYHDIDKILSQVPQ